MRIFYSLHGINPQCGGIYQYSFGLLEDLLFSYKDCYFIIYTYDDDDVNLLRLINTYKNITIVKDLKIKSIRDNYTVNLFLRTINFFSRIFLKRDAIHFATEQDFLKKLHIDIIHYPYQDVKKIEGIPSVTTMHDLQDLHFPEFFTSEERAKRAVIYKNAIDSSDAVVVSYNHIKEDIVRFFHKDPEKVFICPISLKNTWIFSTKEKDCSKDYSFLKKFILYPAATWEHKNHIALLKAFSALLKKYSEMQLVCTGGKTNYFSKIQEVMDYYYLNDNVVFTGIVNDETLLWFYRNCLAVVIPTLYEAGSFPLMESMKLDIPVICSNVTSLPDTINNSDFVFDPKNIIEISEKMEKICFDNDYRCKNIENSKQQSGEFMNDVFSTSVYNIYKKIVK